MMTVDRNHIENLKQAWLKDPSWDIEDTEGFEMHREELLAFRKEKEREQEQAREIAENKIKEQRAAKENAQANKTVERLKLIREKENLSWVDAVSVLQIITLQEISERLDGICEVLFDIQRTIGGAK